jgi:hypothetical protein
MCSSAAIVEATNACSSWGLLVAFVVVVDISTKKKKNGKGKRCRATEGQRETYQQSQQQNQEKASLWYIYRERRGL